MTFCIFFLEVVLFITYIRACRLCVFVYFVFFFAFSEFACRCHCHQLPGETYLQNDLLFVELSAVLSSTHSVSVQHRSPTGFLWTVYFTKSRDVASQRDPGIGGGMEEGASTTGLTSESFTYPKRKFRGST